MPINAACISGKLGALRIFLLVLGLIILGLAAKTYTQSVPEEEVLLSAAITIPCVSVACLILTFFGVIEVSDLTRKFEIGFQTLACIFFLFFSALWLFSVFDIGDPVSCEDWSGKRRCGGFYAKRITTGFLGILNGILHGVIVYSLYTQEPDFN